MLIDRSRSTYSLIARERVVFSKEKHTVARLGLSHRNARAVPVSFLYFLLLIIIEATGTQRCSKCYLVLGETLDDNSGNRHIRAVLGLRLFYVLVAECRHGFESLVRSPFFVDGYFSMGQEERRSGAGGEDDDEHELTTFERRARARR